MDSLTPLQTLVVAALLDAGIALVSHYRRNRSERWVLRLDPGPARSRAATPRGGNVRMPTRPRRVVAVLVSRPAMRVRLRKALRHSPYTLLMTWSWAELRKVVLRTHPAAIFADPLADPGGDPEAHLVALSGPPRAPVILYTYFKPEVGVVLLRLGQRGIRHVIFHPMEDYPEHLAAVFAAIAYEDGGPPLSVA